MKNIYEDLHSNQKILIYEMLKRGISVEVIDAERELIKTSYNGHDELICDRDSSIMPYNVSILAGDKGFTKRNLMINGISVPIGETFLAKDIDYIKKAFKILNCPVVIKPVFGSHGYDVYINLKTEDDVENAIKSIIEHRGELTKIIVEEYYEAQEYRIFITKNGDYAVLLRNPAHVFGDGAKTIKELIEEENYNRMNPRTNALCEILVDNEMYKYLETNGISMNYIPFNGEKVYLRPNSNVAMGGVCEDYTDKTHSSVIDIGMRVLNSFPGLPYVGIDFMTNNIDEKQDENSYRIIEINTVPGIHMHFRPAIGKSQNIAKYMVDMIYPETKDYEKDKINEKPIKGI
ncbi:MAG: ATP-grasp domain-containing protein [Mollicutes bacterium]|nr:ATP-grasp domain-containing protein [Mollicutes bacterium]